MPLLDEIAERLATASTSWVIGSTTGDVSIVLGSDADLPGDNITIIETQGFTPQETLGTNSSGIPHYENPRVQIVCRSTSYESARDNMELAFRTLNSVTNQNLSSTAASSTAFYMRIQALQSPFFVGRDEKKRNLLSVNFQMQRRST